jgi:hypothetical protein
LEKAEQLFQHDVENEWKTKDISCPAAVQTVCNAISAAKYLTSSRSCHTSMSPKTPISLHKDLGKVAHIAVGNRNSYIQRKVLGCEESLCNIQPVFVTLQEEKEYKVKTISRLTDAIKSQISNITDETVKRVIGEQLLKCKSKVDFVTLHDELTEMNLPYT